MADGIIGMEDLLGLYREAGQIDSTGSFTLDPRKAIEKLAEFQLPSSYHWILKVVQALHLAGASRIDIKAGVHSVSVNSDAVPAGFSSIDDLLGHLLTDANHCDPCLRHLAAGLQGSLKTRPRQIQIALVEQGKRRDYELTSGGWRDRGERAFEEAQTVFQLVLNRSVEERISSGWFALNTDIFDLFFRRPASYDRENLVVHDYCQFSSCEVMLDGKAVSDRRFGYPRFPGYDISSDPDPGRSRVPLLKSMFSQEELVANAAVPKHHLVEHLVPSASATGFKVSAHNHATVSNRAELDPEILLERAYAIRMALEPKARLYFVEDGVVIDSAEQDLDCPGLVALVEARALKKDLSTLKVLRDAAFDSVCEDVRRAGKDLLNTAWENLSRMPAPDYVASRLEKMSP